MFMILRQLSNHLRNGKYNLEFITKNLDFLGISQFLRSYGIKLPNIVIMMLLQLKLYLIISMVIGLQGRSWLIFLILPLMILQIHIQFV